MADVRATEARIEALRSDHYAAGDALHDRQGAFYAANAEVTRLEQQLAFARENESRITLQVAQLTEQLGALAAQETAVAADRGAADLALEQALAAREAAGVEEQAAQAALPALEAAVREASAALSAVQQRAALIEQGIRVAETKREQFQRVFAQFAQRRERLDAELATLAAPVTDPLRDVEEQLAQEQADLAAKETALNALRDQVQELQDRQRSAGVEAQAAAKALADLEARAQALAALQAKIGHGKDIDGWLEARGLTDARRLYQSIGVERGWDNALEAVLREAMSGLELPALDGAAAWASDGNPPPRRTAAYARVAPAARAASGDDALERKVALRQPGLERLVADSLHGVRCRGDLAAALADRDAARGRRMLRDPGGTPRRRAVDHVLRPGQRDPRRVRPRARTRRARVRRRPARATAALATRTALTALEEELDAGQQRYHAESLAFGSQQRRCHDLELELMQLKQAAEAAARRRAQLTQELAELAAQEAAEREVGDGAAGRARRHAVEAPRRAGAGRVAVRHRAQRGRSGARPRPRTRARRRAGRAGSRVCRAQLPRAPGRTRAPPRRHWSRRSRSSRACWRS